MATETLRPNGAGSETAITIQLPATGAHWDKVDEEVADDATTCVYQEPSTAPGDSTIWRRDLYALPNSDVGAGTINSVKVYAKCWAQTGGQLCGKVSLRTNGTTYDSAAFSIPAWTDTIVISNTWLVNPQTGIAWTWDERNALEIGESIMYNATNLVTVCTQVYGEIDYTAGGSAIVPISMHYMLAGMR